MEEEAEGNEILRPDLEGGARMSATRAAADGCPCVLLAGREIEGGRGWKTEPLGSATLASLLFKLKRETPVVPVDPPVLPLGVERQHKLKKK